MDADEAHSFAFTKVKSLGKIGSFGSIWQVRGLDEKIYIAKFQEIDKIEWKTLYEWRQQI